MNITAFKALYPDFGMVSSTCSFFGNMKYKFPEYFQNGFFKRSNNVALYVYRIDSFSGHNHYGILAATDIGDVDKGKILKHENTLAAKEQQMMTLLLERKAMIKPVILMHPKSEELDKVIKQVIKTRKPLFDTVIEPENDHHFIYRIEDRKTINKIEDIFKKKIPKSYIADGHHRCSTTVILKKNKPAFHRNLSFDQLLTVYFSFDQLDVYDYNRVVEALQDISHTRFMARLSQVAKITPLDQGEKPSKKFQFSMYINKEWYSLQWKKKYIKEAQSKNLLLDANLFNKLILKDIIGIEDVRSDQRVKYVEGTKGVKGVMESVDKNPDKVGFCIFPVSIEELKQTADNNRTLPPKSTWFEPRMKNGLISQEF